MLDRDFQGEVTKMRLFNSFLVALTALLAAGSAAATVTVNNSTTATTLNVGDTFTVAVRLTYDGEAGLQGVFSSTQWDASVLQLQSHTAFPSSILAFVDPDTADVIPGLSRLGGDNQPGDPAGILRTVQYGGVSAVDTRAATTGSGRLISTLTFKVIGGAGQTSIASIIAAGDSGATGNQFVNGTSASVTINAIPEPGTALLMGLGLAGLGFAGRRR